MAILIIFVTNGFFQVDARFVAIQKSSQSYLRAAILSRNNWVFTHISANQRCICVTPSIGSSSSRIGLFTHFRNHYGHYSKLSAIVNKCMI
jgi:hypothetical protein